MDAEFLKEQIDVIKATIRGYMAADLAFATGGTQSYTFDTGQSRITVTKIEARSIQKNIDQLFNRLATLEARLYGGAVTARPGF